MFVPELPSPFAGGVFTEEHLPQARCSVDDERQRVRSRLRRDVEQKPLPVSRNIKRIRRAHPAEPLLFEQRLCGAEGNAIGGHGDLGTHQRVASEEEHLLTIATPMQITPHPISRPATWNPSREVVIRTARCVRTRRTRERSIDSLVRRHRVVRHRPFEQTKRVALPRECEHPQIEARLGGYME